MADAWQSAWVEVVPDFSGFRAKANREMEPILSSAGDSAGRESSKKFSGSFLGGLGLLTAGIAALGLGRLIGDAISTGIDQLQQSVTAASGLNESVNALNVSFGDASAGVQELGQSAAKSLGLSNLEFNSLAVRFSAFAGTIAGDGGDVVGVIDELTTRGADFASVFNLEVSDALGLFQSGLAGETEPLRQFGIDLSAAAVNAYAYANGIAETGTQLTEAEKVQARYGLLMQSTSMAQGDFANTSGELANQQRILNAQFEDAQAKLGTALLPALTSLITLANDQLMPVLNQMVDQIGPQLATALEESTPAIIDMVRQVAPLIPQLVELATAVLPPLISLIQLLAPMVRDWAATWTGLLVNVKAFFGFLNGNVTLQEFAGVVRGTAGTSAEFGRVLGTTFATVKRGVEQFAVDAIAAVGRFAAGVNQMAVTVVGTIGALPGRILGFFSGAGSWLFNAGQQIIRGLIGGISSMIGAAVNAAVSAGNAIIGAAKGILGIRSPSRVFRDQVGKMIGLGLIEGIDSMRSGVTASIDRLAYIPPIASVRPGAFHGADSLTRTGSGAGVNFTFVNPVAEKSSETIRRQSQMITAALAV